MLSEYEYLIQDIIRDGADDVLDELKKEGDYDE